jgi:hypothetical protein
MVKYFALVSLALLDLAFLVAAPYFISVPNDFLFLFGVLLVILIAPINFYVIKWMFK